MQIYMFFCIKVGGNIDFCPTEDPQDLLNQVMQYSARYEGELKKVSSVVFPDGPYSSRQN